MALLPIVQYPDPRLAMKADPVTVFDDELKQLAADMAETMYEAPGVGLAATQIGRNIRMVVIDISEEKNALKVFVNPEVIEHSEELNECEEGCLSLPGIYEKVKRPAHVKVRAQDLDGNTFEIACDELLSVCVQHEIDHLNGTVFVDHLSALKKQRSVQKLAKRRKEEARAKAKKEA
ncbi:MAG: peptide deformylase [Sutterellaceae bacterium]|nr:peptide deformylase [Sutterellaceae bacterium]